MGISKQYLDALFATQLLLIISLHSEFSDEIAELIVVVILDITCRNLCYVSQYMGCIRILILPDGASLYVEAWESEHFLTEDGEFFF